MGRVSEYLGVVSGEAVIGANLFRDMFASVRDVVGGRAGDYAQHPAYLCRDGVNRRRHSLHSGAGA